MKGTPFYTGESARREGPASDRVNLWPIAYYRNPALSVLWPIGEFSDDRFAIRPIFSMYREDEKSPWHEYNWLGGLVSFDSRNQRRMVFPAFWGRTPLGSSTNEYFNVFPLYWSDRNEARGTSRNILFPLWDMRRLGKGHRDNRFGLFLAGEVDDYGGYRNWVFPLWYWHDLGPNNSTLLTLPYCRKNHTVASPLLLSWWGPGHGRIALGLAGWQGNRHWVAPFYLRDPDRGRFLSLAYARDRDWTAVPPLLSAWGPGWGRLALGLGGWEGDASWFAPFYYRDAASDRTISPLYASGRGWAAVPPLLSWWTEDGGTRILLGLGGADGNRHWCLPLWYRDADADLLVTPLWGRQRDRWSAVPPLLSWRVRDPATGAASTFLLGGLAGATPGAHWFAPLYFRDERRDRFYSLLYASGPDFHAIPPLLTVWNRSGSTILSPLYVRGLRDAGIPPLLTWWDKDRVCVLFGLAGWERDGSRHWALPFYVRDASRNQFLSLVYASDGDRRVLPVLLSAWGHDWGRIALGLGGWDADSSWLVPFWYRAPDRFMTPLWGRMNKGEDTVTWWATPLFGTRSGSSSGSWLFPLWDLEWNHGKDHRDLGYDHRFLLLGGARSGRRFGGRSSVWFWPLFSDETNPRLDALRAEMDASRAPDREFFRKETRVNWRYDVRPRTATTNLVEAPVRDAAREESEFLLGLGGSEHRVVLNGDAWRLAEKFGGAPAEGPLARFVDPNGIRSAAISAKAGAPGAPAGIRPASTNDVARYVSEDSDWLFPLWSHERTRGVMFELPSGEKSLDAELETFRALLFLYDYRREAVPEEGHDYARRRVLWRLYHYEKLNGDESTDVFPAITYDRRKDGYRKVSFLWRLFRYERDPEKGTTLDVLFLPLRRP